MSNRIYFEHTLKNKINSIQRENLSFIKLTKDNFSFNQEMIVKTIDVFNSQIDWDEMWTVDIANTRLLNGEILYLLLNNHVPMGHVWYNVNYLYNAFVSNTREDGDSVWFIQETMWDIKNHFNLNHIQLYVDTWNKRAIKFWKKLGFSIINL